MQLFHKTFSHLKDFPSAMWVVCASAFLNQMGFMAFPFLLVFLTQHIGLSLVKASFVFVVFGISVITASFIGGNIVDKVGPEKTLITALLGNAIVLFIFAFIHAYVMILVMCFLWGVTYGIYRPASQTLVSFLSQPGTQKITFAVYRFAINLGVSIGPAIGGFLIAKSFSLIFIINSSCNLIAALMLLFGLKKVSYVSQKFTHTLTLLEGISLLKKDKLFTLFLVGILLPSMVFFLHMGPLSIYLTKDLHFSYEFFGLLFTLNTLIIVFFEILLNVAMEDVSHRISLMIGSVFIALSFLGLAWLTSIPGIVLLAIGWTIGEMILFPVSNAFVADIAPENVRGSYMGLFAMFGNIAMFGGLWLGTMGLNYLGAKELWIFSGIWGLLSLVFFIRLPKKLSIG